MLGFSSPLDFKTSPVLLLPCHPPSFGARKNSHNRRRANVLGCLSSDQFLFQGGESLFLYGPLNIIDISQIHGIILSDIIVFLGEN